MTASKERRYRPRRRVEVTRGGRELLDIIAARGAERPLYVFRQPEVVGGGVDNRVYERLKADGLVELGAYRPGLGRPLLLTADGLDQLERRAR